MVGELRSVATHFEEFGRAVDEGLRDAERLPFLRRLNVLAHKLRRAQAYLAMHNWKYAQYHLHATWHDLRALRRLLETAGAALSSRLVCD